MIRNRKIFQKSNKVFKIEKLKRKSEVRKMLKKILLEKKYKNYKKLLTKYKKLYIIIIVLSN